MVDYRLRICTSIQESQVGIILGQYTTKAITIRQTMKYYTARINDMHLTFIDLEKI